MTSKSRKETVYSAVLSSVINGTYPAGSYLSEKAVMEEMQVSRAPVREALIELCCKKILKNVPRKGYLVVKCTEQELRELIEFRILLECGALEKCFDSINATQIMQLDKIVENEFLFLRRHDVQDYWNSSVNFHTTLASYSQNVYIYDQIYEAMHTCMRAYLQLYWKEWSVTGFPPPSELHARIVNCIREHDRDRALDLLRQDIDTFANSDKHPKGDCE